MINMTARKLSQLMFAAAALSIALTGCNTSQDSGTTGNGSFSVDGTTVEASGSPLVATQDGAETPEAPVAEAPSGESAPAIDPEVRRSVEVRYLTNRAEKELAAGTLTEARQTVDAGLKLAPEDPALVELRARIMAAFASRGETTSAANPEAEALSTLGEYVIEADRIQKAATDAEARADWSAAEQAYTKLRRLIQFAPYQAELRDKYEARTLAGLHAAQIELRKQRDREELRQAEDAAKLQELLVKSREQKQREEIVELWRQALYQLELKSYNRATELVDQILYIDRVFKPAIELRAEIDQLRLENTRRDVFERKMLGYRNALLELRMAMIPDTALVNYPQGQLAALIRERKKYLPDAVRPDKEALAIQTALDTTIVPLSFEGTPISEVVKFIRNEAGINILLKDVDPNRAVNIELANVPLSDALNIICSQMKLLQVIQNGVLMIAAEGATVSDELVTRVHDIRDITFQLPAFQAPVLNLRSNNAAPPLTVPDDGYAPIETDEVLDFITTGVAPDSWDDTRIAELFGGQLVVTHTAKVQAEIRDFLNSLRRIAGLLVAVEARFITIEDDFLSDFGIDFRGLGGPASVPNQANLTLEDVSSNAEDNAGGAFDNGNLGVPTANPSAGIFFNTSDPRGQVNFNRDITGRFENIFDNSLGSRLTSIGGLAMQVAIFRNLTQINAVIQAVQKTGRARTLVSPRLSAYNSQRANIAIINQVPYIRDFEVVTAAAAGIANPIMDTILDGIVLEVVPTISNDRRFITIEVQPTVAELLLPIPTFVTTLGPSSAVTIQIPELKIQSAKTTVRVPDGGAVVIGGLKSARDVDRESATPILSDIPLLGILFRRKGRSVEQSNLVIVIKAHVVDLNDEELRQPGWH